MNLLTLIGWLELVRIGICQNSQLSHLGPKILWKVDLMPQSKLDLKYHQKLKRNNYAQLLLQHILKLWQMNISNSDNFQFRQFEILIISNSDKFQFWQIPILTISNYVNFQFWHFPILIILTNSNSDKFKFWRIQILTISNYEFPILTISNSDNFQCLQKEANGFWQTPILTNSVLPFHLPTALSFYLSFSADSCYQTLTIYSVRQQNPTSTWKQIWGINLKNRCLTFTAIKDLNLAVQMSPKQENLVQYERSNEWIGNESQFFPAPIWSKIRPEFF